MNKDKYNNDIEEFCNQYGCDVTVFQNLDVCVPIAVEPYVNLHEAEVECLDEPCIVTNPNWSKGKNGTCRFSLVQKLCIVIPVEFRAKATSGPTSVVCGDISDEGCPDDCRPDECHPDDCHPDDCRPDECHPDECHPDDCRPDECCPNKCHPDDCRPDECCPNKCHSFECHSNECRPNKCCDNHEHDTHQKLPFNFYIKGRRVE